MSGTCWGADSTKLMSYTPTMLRAPRADPGWCQERAAGRECCPPGICRARGRDEGLCEVGGDVAYLWPVSSALHRPPPLPADADLALRAAATDAFFPRLQDLVALLGDLAAKGGLTGWEAAELEELKAWLGRLYVEYLERRRQLPKPSSP
jgi:hypothetical protein